MSSRPRHILYTWFVVVLGWGALVYLFKGLDLDLGREFLVMAALGVLAEWLAVSFPQGQLSGSFSVVLASYLIYGLSPAAWISALYILISQGIVNRGNPLRTALFNAGQYVMALLFAGYLFERSRVFFADVQYINFLLPLIVFIVAYFVLNHLLVYFYILPKSKFYSLAAWADTLRWDGFTYLFSVPFGLMIHIIYGKTGIYGAFLMFLPVLVVQFVLRLYMRVELNNRELFALYQVAKRLVEPLSMEEIMELILREARRVVAYHTGVVYLWSENAKCYTAAAVSGSYADQFSRTSVEKGEGFIGWTIENKRSEIIYDSRTDPRLKKEAGLFQVHRSLLVISLCSETETLGAFVLGDKRPLAFEERHLHTLAVIGGQAAIAAANSLLKRRLDVITNTDALTGIYNHRYFFHQMDSELRRSKDAGLPLTLIKLDVDSFKSINDFYGYQTGDLILIELAGLVRDLIGNAGIVAHYGGEEFIILLPEYGEERGLSVAKSLHQSIRGYYFQVGDLPGKVRVSIGMAVCPDHASDVSGLVRKADQALHRAKEAGKDRVMLAFKI